MTRLDSTGYYVAAAFFGALSLMLATRWRRDMSGSLLLPASIISVLWALDNATAPGDVGLDALVLESARDLAWIAFLTRALGGFGTRSLSLTMRLGPWLVGGLALALGTLVVTLPGLFGGHVSLAKIVFVTGLSLSLFGFVLVEQALRNTRSSYSWGVKFLWLGAGAIFAYDIALYSASYASGGLQGAMYAARGFAAAVIVPLLAIGVRRAKGFRPQVFMSQSLAFHTTSMVIAGVYLLCVAVVAYYVQRVGGRYGDALEVLWVFLGLLGLVAALVSRAVRAQLRVALAKHFFPYKYDYRQEWLDLTSRLARDAGETSLPQRALEAFIYLGRVTNGAILVLRDTALQFGAGDAFGSLDGVVEPADSPFSRYLCDHEWILDLDRFRRGEGDDAEVPVPRWLSVLSDARVAIPLIHEQRLYALVILRRARVAEPLTWEELDLWRTAARQAASYFAFEHSADALGRERQFAALNRFTAFVMHDLSNIVAQQRLIVENAARHKTNPAFVDDAIETIDLTVRRISRLLDQLKGETGGGPPARRVRLADVCAATVQRMKDRTPEPTSLTLDPKAETIVPVERFEHVLEHLIRNAQDATPATGTVSVSVATEGSFAVISVTDSGHGMSAEFIRDRLFRPFDTTKGTKGMGIGAFQAREFVRAYGGDVQVTSAPGSGTSFVIRLPLVN